MAANRVALLGHLLIVSGIPNTLQFLDSADAKSQKVSCCCVVPTNRTSESGLAARPDTSCMRCLLAYAVLRICS
ncbi:hypothetical protein CC77DRAFT_1017557 [Alternaria alternata]|uniref:Secreted protein n=1 Tax=Alternaria alternata TaxID=5599 RepID=A0A177DWB9_ALTAL|nr:hypothetical protein CC77DRAFT_1017557 [Alternaria alternata]OAG23937.1 hypothetical protein CC77DRAFT_1017557 [Alternaria alternata]